MMVHSFRICDKSGNDFQCPHTDCPHYWLHKEMAVCGSIMCEWYCQISGCVLVKEHELEQESIEVEYESGKKIKFRLREKKT